MYNVQVQNIKWSHYHYDLSDGFGFYIPLYHIPIPVFRFVQQNDKIEEQIKCSNEMHAKFFFFCTQAHDQFAMFITFNTINRDR